MVKSHPLDFLMSHKSQDAGFPCFRIANVKGLIKSCRIRRERAAASHLSVIAKEIKKPAALGHFCLTMLNESAVITF